MKKTLLLLASAALLLVGCAKEKFAEPSDGGLTNVTFTASLENGVATKAAVDGDGAAANVNRCIMEIYYGGERYTRQYAPVNDQKKATFTVQVVSNRKYTVAFWADKVDDASTEEGRATDKYYTTNATGGLQAITINSSYIGNDDARDAFYHVGEYTVAQAGSSFGTTEQPILLKRPFAQMNVITTDWDKVASIAALKPEKVNVTLKNALVNFNAVTGEASGSQTLTYEAAVYTSAANGAEKTLSMDYLFASTTKALIDIDWKALHGTDANVEHSFAAVPYQRNYRTNIKGALLTTQGQWTVTVDPDWTTPEYTHPVVIATTLAEAQAAVGPTATGAEAAGTVIVKPEAIESRTAADEKTKEHIAEKSPTIDLTDLPDGAMAIEFVLTSQSKKDVTFELPALPDENFYWYIRHETGYPTENLNVKVSDNDATRVIIDAPNNTHVVLNDVEYTHVIAITGDNTLVVPAGITVDKLTVKKGGVEIHGTVTTLEVAPGTDQKVYFRACEGLSADVFKKIYSEEEPVCNYIDPWYTYEQVEGSKYNIYKRPVVATIGEKEYKSLEDAIAAVANGQTINIVDDVDDAAGISVPSEKNFTVDFGGHTYAMECPGAGSAGTKTAGFQLLKNSTIVFKNGTIKCTDANKEKTWESGSTSKGIALMIQNYANLTLEDITIDATNIAHNGAAVRYALSNNSGNVEYKGNTTITTKSGDYAFDVCKNGSYPEPTVTWNSTGTVTGGIELTGGEFIVAKDLVLSDPIMTMDAAAKLTVNASITPVTGWTYETTRDALVIIKRTGNLTVNGTGKISSNNVQYVYAAVKMTNGGESETGDAAKLTVNGTVTLEGLYYGICGNGSRQNTEITINGGTIKGTAANDNIGIYHPQAGSLTINGGIIEGSTGIALKGGKLVVNDGTIIGNGVSATFSHNGSGWNNTGDALAVEVCDYPGQNPPQTDLSAEIKGGKFASTNGKPVASYVQPDKSYTPLAGFIFGGLFNKAPEASLVSAGYSVVENTDEATKAKYPWTVEAQGQAKIGDVVYPTLEDAVAEAVEAGSGTIELLPAYIESGRYPQAWITSPCNIENVPQDLVQTYTFHAFNPNRPSANVLSDEEIYEKCSVNINFDNPESSTINMNALNDNEKERVDAILAECNDYLNWPCDYEVYFDNADNAQVSIQGNYAGYGWTSCDINQALGGNHQRLLLTMLGEPLATQFNYTAMLGFVNQFHCGLSNGDAVKNAGKTFSVELYMYHPENENVKILISRTDYKFPQVK